MRDFMTLTDFKNIAFISTRIAGTDGVSLEIEKWADVFVSAILCTYDHQPVFTDRPCTNDLPFTGIMDE